MLKWYNNEFNYYIVKMELHSAAQGHPHFWSIFSIFVSILQYLIIINSFKQEDHDDPISLT